MIRFISILIYLFPTESTAEGFAIFIQAYRMVTRGLARKETEEGNAVFNNKQRMFKPESAEINPKLTTISL